MAQSRHAELRCTCLLSGVKRTCSFALHMSAFDPKRRPARRTPTSGKASRPAGFCPVSCGRFWRASESHSAFDKARHRPCTSSMCDDPPEPVSAHGKHKSAPRRSPPGNVHPSTSISANTPIEQGDGASEESQCEVTNSGRRKYLCEVERKV